MKINVRFHSYFKDLAGCEATWVETGPAATLADLLERVGADFPKWAALRRSTLVAVGLDFQRPDYPLKEGDEVSLFPPVQGG